MANRSITVTLRANVQDFKSQFDAATKAADQTAKATERSAKRADTAMGRMVQSAQDNRQAWDQAGGTLTAFGAAALGGLGLATKAAMDWESSWAGVQKTVDGTAPQMAALEEGLRGLARELPASHQEIAAVAEAAGQLGIETPNILGFTRTMIDMGEATNLSAEEAAVSLSRFMNITQTSQGDVGKLGASVVGLGNNFATTEREIVDMSMRIAGAGEQAGLTEGEIFGMATALSSVGIEAEAGGTAISRTMKRIGMEVDTGGDKLDTFAQVAGMSAEQFSTAWREDPAAAMDAFVTGLSNTEQMGMSTNEVLSELGITAIRESDSLLRLSAAGTTLGDAMAMGNAEFDKGSALIEEASKRYETAESRAKMAGNAIVDAGISIGATFLPAVAEAADGVADLAGWFSELPGPVHAALGGLSGIAGAASLGAGGFLLLFPRVMDTVSAFKDLRAISPRASGALGRVGKAAGIAGAAFVVLAGASAVAEIFSEAAVSADEMTAKLLNLAETSGVTAEDIDKMVAITGTGGASVKDFGYALESVDMNGFMKGLDFVGSGFGMFDSDVSLAKEQIASLDQAMSTFAMSGAWDNLYENFGAAVESAAEYGYSAEDVIAQMPGLQTALAPVATELGLQADNATLAKIATGELTPVVDEAAGAAYGYAEGMGEAAEETQSAADAAAEALTAIQDLANEFIGAERGALDYKSAIQDVGDAIDENGKHWEDGTQAADDNKSALLDLADQAWATADAFAADNKSGTFLKDARQDLIDTAIEMGASEEAAKDYADQLLGTPEEIETIITADTNAAREEWTKLWDDLGYHPPQVPVGADTDPAKGEVDEFTGLLGDQPPTDVGVGADTDPAQGAVDEFSGGLSERPPSDVKVGANVTPAQSQVDGLEAAVDAAGGTITVNGNTVPADASLDTIMGLINSSDGTVTINGEDYPANSALGQVIAAINRSGGTVDIDGDPSGANSATDGAKRKADGTTGTMDVHANTGGAESSIDHTARPRSSRITATASTAGANRSLNYVARSRTSTIRVTTIHNSRVGQGPGGSGGITRAAGGPVHGPGTGTSDSIPAHLSNNEHVWTANEVGVAGGHQAIYSLRQQILAGAKTLHLATGGGVENGSVAPVQYAPVYRQAQGQSGPVTATLPPGLIASEIRQGFESATVIAQVSDRVAANLYQRGKSGSRAYGGAR